MTRETERAWWRLDELLRAEDARRIEQAHDETDEPSRARLATASAALTAPPLTSGSVAGTPKRAKHA